MRAGVDEAGRGPLAGPVTAAAVILDCRIPGLDDSKKLSASRREDLYDQIIGQARAWAIARAQPGEIDRYNIHHATLLAMRRAVLALRQVPDECVIDGKFVPELPCAARAVIGADASVTEVSAASILAKVSRDREMREWDLIYPQYGFAAHKGYPTRVHRVALQRFGATAIHRLSYAPVAQATLVRA